MSTLIEALTAYRAAVVEVRRAEHAKQQAAQALYEARQLHDDTIPATGNSGEALPSEAFRATIAYVGEPTKDGRVIEPGKVDWQFNERLPLTFGFDGAIIGYAIPSHIEEDGSVMATIYVEEGVVDALGIGLDNVEMSVGEAGRTNTTAGRLRHVAVLPKEAAAWPGVVVNHEV